MKLDVAEAVNGEVAAVRARGNRRTDTAHTLQGGGVGERDRIGGIGSGRVEPGDGGIGAAVAVTGRVVTGVDGLEVVAVDVDAHVRGELVSLLAGELHRGAVVAGRGEGVRGRGEGEPGGHEGGGEAQGAP